VTVALVASAEMWRHRERSAQLTRAVHRRACVRERLT
jgi:hypothetical protein